MVHGASYRRSIPWTVWMDLKDIYPKRTKHWAWMQRRLKRRLRRSERRALQRDCFLILESE